MLEQTRIHFNNGSILFSGNTNQFSGWSPYDQQRILMDQQSLWKEKVANIFVKSYMMKVGSFLNLFTIFHNERLCLNIFQICRKVRCANHAAKNVGKWVLEHFKNPKWRKNSTSLQKCV
jgi:hypothetical protein